MKMKLFTTDVSADLNCNSDAGLWIAIRRAVPQDERRKASGYRLWSQQPVGDNGLRKNVTIKVSYR